MRYSPSPTARTLTYMKVNAARSAVTCRCATETGKVLGPYLTLLRGIAFEHKNIRWAEHALRLIGQRFGQ